MSPLTMIWALFLAQYRFAISNCEETENVQNKLENKPNVDKLGESSGVKRTNTSKPLLTYGDAFGKAGNSRKPDDTILAGEIEKPQKKKSIENASIQIPDRMFGTSNRTLTLRSTSSTSNPSNRRSSDKLNPNAATFQPKTDRWKILPNVAATSLGNSANKNALSLNPNARTFQPKIYPLTTEMYFLSEHMKRIEPEFPPYENKIRFYSVLIVMYDCLHAKKFADPFDDPSMITSISIFESRTGKLIYKAYPKVDNIPDLAAYRNPELLDEVDPEMRKDEVTIGNEITKVIKDRVIVGISLSKIIRRYKLKTRPFEVREITSLVKYADILQMKPGNVRKDSIWFRNHKELLGTFLPELRKEFQPRTVLTEKHKKTYILKLFGKLRHDWESEVVFLRRLFGYYRLRPESELRNVMDRLGKTYPGLHSDLSRVIQKEVTLPEELVGLHIRYDKWNDVIVSITAFDSKTKKIFKAFVRNVDDIQIDSTGAILGRFKPLVNYIFQKKLLRGNAKIVGFDLYKLAQIFDLQKKLKGARIYDTKIIFDAETVTELAYKYLKIDYRYTFLEKFTDEKRSEKEERESFEECDVKFPIELAAKVALQMFRLYTLDDHYKVQALKLWE